MKKSKIVAVVVYFIFTFGIGLIFAVTLPGYFSTFTVPAELVEEALEAGDFLTGVVLAEPIGFGREPVLEKKFEGGGGVVLYEAVAEVYDRSSVEEGADPDKLKHGMLYKCYEGFLYGVSDRYDVFSTDGNGTSLLVTTETGETVLPLLDYDENGDGRNDGISTFAQNGFVVLEIKESDVPSVGRLSFTDRSGAVVFEAEAEGFLEYESAFYDCFGDVDAYNELVRRGLSADVSDEEAEEINEARNAYVRSVTDALENAPGCASTAGSAEYKAAAEAVSKRANRKAIPFIVGYFVAIYVIADFLLGSHYIVKFFKWFLFRVCKIPHKEKAPPREDVFRHDYYSMVTLKLDVSEVPEFCGGAEIKYTCNGEEAAFALTEEDGYEATLRLKAGVYVNPFLSADKEYAPVDLPDNLIVEGYRMEKTIKIVKREV